VERARIAVDPGIGFGKTVRHNLRLLDELAAFHVFGCPILLGASRKSFLNRLSGGGAPVTQRMPGSVAAALMGAAQAVHIMRVHDVAAMRQALAVWEAAQRA
jgi:dihydropteroate synthase